MQRAGDVALVALRLLAHVEHLHRPLLEQALELAEVDRPGLLRRRDAGDVAGELQEPDRAEAAGRALRFVVVARVQHDPLVGVEDEAGPRRKR